MIITWRDWFERHGLTELCEFPDDVWNQIWAPTNADRRAAWDLYTEMRTRISTQPLQYLSGIEKTALESIYRLFGFSREVMRKHGPQCRHFATISVEVLNVSIRPFTAKWHGRSDVGRLDADDDRHGFRGELHRLQKPLREFQRLLGLLAEGNAFVAGTESGFQTISQKQVPLGGAIRFNQLQGLPESNAHELLAAERQEIADRRVAVGLPRGTDDLVGLAISGGGIRSATFAQGVLQGIAAKGLFKEVDLLSTVSGGGYVGGFLSSYLNDASSPKESCTDIGPGGDQLPFRRIGNCESAPLRFIRNHSKYLLPAGFLGRLTMIAQGLYGVLMNFVILFTLLMLALVMTRYSFLPAMNLVATAVQRNEPLPLGQEHFFATLCVAGIWGVLVFFLPLVQKLSRLSKQSRPARSWYETLCVGLFGMTLLIGFFQVIPFGYYAFLRLNTAMGLFNPTNLQFTQGGIWALFGNALAFVSARGLLKRPTETEVTDITQASLLRKLSFVLLALAGPLLIVVLYYLLTHWLLVMKSIPAADVGPISLGPDGIMWVLFLLPLVYTWGFLNVNLISPQRYYRNRLAETYLLKPQKGQEEVHAMLLQRLSELGNTNKAPYHLINAALNLPSSRIPNLRGRDSDFFLFSKHYCGSPVVGYRTTKKWEAVDGFLDLGTAVAISGAAASPHMGASTPRGASFFLTLLNVRLGYWLRRPEVGVMPSPIIKAFGGPGPWYLFREMFGRFHEHCRFLNISDGGHIENLAVYELLRRRCKFIIAIDGECDTRLEFPSLMKLQQYAWIDFGTSIDLDINRLRLTDDGWSRAHIAFGRIIYHSGELGFLLYIKLSVTGNERDYLLDYRQRNSPFPHQSTLDQLFDEAQFEAYRALGEHVTEDLFCEEFLGDLTEYSPLTVRDWYQGLANNLLQE